MYTVKVFDNGDGPQRRPTWEKDFVDVRRAESYAQRHRSNFSFIQIYKNGELYKEL